MFPLLGGFGVIVDDTDPDQPTVKVKGDTEAHVATNFVHGYTPVAGDVVFVVSVDGGGRVVVGVRDGAPESS